jgi:branched-chain amino acid aminotransferase
MPGVATFEIRDGSTRAVGHHASLAAASAALPAGAYSSLRTYDGHRLLRLDRHLDRLAHSLAGLGRAAPRPGTAETAAGIARALRATGHPESRLRLTLAPPALFVSVERFEALPAQAYRDGVACVTVALHRDNPASKDTRFISPAAGAYASLPPGAQEGLMLAEDGAILEGLSSNFFAVSAGVLRSEGERALPGVTRSLVLELAADLLPFAASAPRTSELRQLSEAFVTSVSREIVPVVRVDGVTIGGGRPGPVTIELMRRFRELVEREAASVFT